MEARLANKAFFFTPWSDSGGFLRVWTNQFFRFPSGPTFAAHHGRWAAGAYGFSGGCFAGGTRDRKSRLPAGSKLRPGAVRRDGIETGGSERVLLPKRALSED